MTDSSTLTARTGSTAASSALAAVGLRSEDLFLGGGPVHQATLFLDADLPARTELLKPGTEHAALVRLGPPTSVPAAQTLCIKLPDAYGPGQDQDFLLASSADGAPLHHLTLPAASRGARLYSSLWLYAAGLRPLLFGLLPLPEGASFGPGTVVPFAASGPIGRFRRIGDLRLGDEITDAAAIDLTFAARNDGGGLRALPPARFYRSPSRY